MRALDAQGVEQFDDVAGEVGHRAGAVGHGRAAVAAVVEPDHAEARVHEPGHLRVPHAEVAADRPGEHDDLAGVRAGDLVVRRHSISCRIEGTVTSPLDERRAASSARERTPSFA